MTNLLRIVALLFLVTIVALGWWKNGTTPAPLEVADDAPAAVDAIPATVAPAASSTEGRQVVATSIPLALRTLRIVDRHGAPVADALVAVTDAPPPEHDVPFADVETEFADLPRCRSASDGTVVVEGAAPTRYVLARKGDAFGCGPLHWDVLDPVPELVLAADRNVEVRVVGPDGAPRADVPVQIWMHTATPHRAMWEGGPVRSDHRGRLTLWHAQALDHWDRAAPAVQLEPQVFGADTERHHVPLADPLPDPVDVPCPAHGWLRIRARLPDGSPLPVGGRWRVTTADVGADGEPELAPGAAAGELRLGPVALGRHWDVRVEGFEPVVVDGPRVEGAEVAVELVLASDARLATLRLQWADGHPVANRKVWLDEDWQRPVTSDEQGRIVFLLPGPGATVQVESETPRRRGEFVVPERVVGPGWFDLGTVRLRDQQLLVAGCVVEAGTGVAVAASLTVEAADRSVVSQIDTDGSFAFWTEDCVAPEVWIRASAEGYEDGEVTVPRGSSDMQLALQPRPRLLVTLLCDGDVGLDEHMDVWMERGDRQWRPFAERVRRGETRYAFPIPQEVGLAKDPVVRLWRLDGEPLPWTVTRSSWEPCEGGYRATLDLRGRLARTAVRPVVDGADSRVRCLFVRASDGDGSWVDVASAGRPTWSVPRDVTHDAIVLSTYGFPLRARLLAGENVLDLPPPATVVVTAVGWPEELRGKVRLRQCTWNEPLLDELAADDVLAPHLRPRSRETEEKWYSPRGAVARPSGPGTTFAVVCRGRYRLVPWVIGDDGERPLPDAAVEVDVTTPGQRIEVTLRVDPAVVRATAR